MSNEWTAGDVTALLASPFYVITIAEYFTEPHSTSLNEETWIKINVDLIKDLGPEAYLRNLLAILRGDVMIGYENGRLVRGPADPAPPT